MTRADLMEEREWHASLPGVIVSAAALIGDGHDGVLLVKPNYRDHWLLPGGICEFAEPPHEACAREVAEELGLDLAVGQLLAIDWREADSTVYGPQARPTMHLIFDAGVLSDTSGIVLQAEEVDDWRFVAVGELAAYLPDRAMARATAAVEARHDGLPRYVPPRPGSSGTQGTR
jgi:8-oxo-dGTP diphosphatase